MLFWMVWKKCFRARSVSFGMEKGAIGMVCLIFLTNTFLFFLENRAKSNENGQWSGVETSKQRQNPKWWYVSRYKQLRQWHNAWILCVLAILYSSGIGLFWVASIHTVSRQIFYLLDWMSTLVCIAVIRYFTPCDSVEGVKFGSGLAIPSELEFFSESSSQNCTSVSLTNHRDRQFSLTTSSRFFFIATLSLFGSTKTTLKTPVITRLKKNTKTATDFSRSSDISVAEVPVKILVHQDHPLTAYQ